MKRYGNMEFVFHKGKAICERFEGICDAKYAIHAQATAIRNIHRYMKCGQVLIAAALLRSHIYTICMRLFANCLLNFHHMCLSREPQQQQQQEIVVYSFIVFMYRHLYPSEWPLTFDTKKNYVLWHAELAIRQIYTYVRRWIGGNEEVLGFNMVKTLQSERHEFDSPFIR